MMGTENSESKSGSGADSYIGSLISLTSKSEIRYEGVLYNINTEDSSIGLRNVRSFGTEGRKKDGPQVPPSDKVYEYILFRGRDIKDLQVKSSPPVQPAAPINDDHAIIQHSQPQYILPVSSPTGGLPSAASRPLTDLGSQSSQMGLPGSSFQGGLPLYQGGGNLGPWGASAPPSSANGSGLAMPMYWQGYYGPPNGLPQLHQQSLLQLPPGLQMPPLRPMQYPNFNTPFPTGLSNLHSSSLPEVPPSLLPSSTISANLTSASLPSSTLPPLPYSSSASETLPSLLSNKAPSSVLPTAVPGAIMASLPPLTASTPELNSAVPTSDMNNGISGSSLPIQSTSQSASSILGTSSSVRTETPRPSLVTPGQLLQSGSTVVQSSQSSITVQKDVLAVEVSAPPSAPVAKEAQPPILSLPVPSQPAHKPNGAHFQSRGGYRERARGRGTWGSRPMTKYTEDFDFMAMNEKFNKDEVWGDLGKSELSKDKEVDASDEDGFLEEHAVELPKIDAKTVYNKDDFFDSLSCNAIGHDSQNGRPRFSEQRKIDTETFGEFARNHGGRGGRGRGGRHHGYYGRGYGHYGYNNRGRGRTMPSRDS